MSIYKKLGVEPIINATGNVTRLGGSRLRAVALEAYALASQQSVSLEHLQAAASQQIANLTGAEAGLITSGAAAGLTLGSAAILTGLVSKWVEIRRCNEYLWVNFWVTR